MVYKKVWHHEDAEYRAEAFDRLRTLFPQGSKVTTIVVNVTRSGMGRSIMVLAYETDKQRIRNVSMDVARVLDWRYDDQRGAVYVEGCGMDMCFHLTYTLARVLYYGEGEQGREGYLLEQRTV